MKPWPLRWKLIIWSVLISGVALVTFAVAALFSLYFVELKSLDSRMKNDAVHAFNELNEVSASTLSEVSTAVLDGTLPIYGYVLGPLHGKGQYVFPETLQPLAESWPKKPGFSSVNVGGKHLRVGVFVEKDQVLLLASDLRPIRELVEDLRTAYLSAMPVVLLLVAAGGWWIASRALRPISDITQVASQITANKLHERIPVEPTNDEISRHVQVLNGMFDRLQRSFEQTSRFAADASHELRTPLTIMRGELEAAVRSENFNPDQKRLLTELLEETAGLQKITDDLLLLARLDAPDRQPFALTPVNLSLLTQEAFEDAELLASSQEIKLQADIAPHLVVAGDALLLRRVLLNLLDNAVRHNRPQGELRLGLKQEGDYAVLTIGNTGLGIPAQEQPRLFQRFFRPNSDRNRETGGSGLGLSLSREILAAHQGEIKLVRSESDWTEFCVRCPIVAPS
ncbi:MAG TPA: ATP-binding protein [Opitutaceae bacterium]|nr:ATP-binding protein [Opitutaceae bacterium]